jgi:GWxTD domain-containing protein
MNFYSYTTKRINVRCLRLLFVLWLLPLSGSFAQELTPFKNEIPFGIRMNFFKGPIDSTSCLVTISVDNRNLLFYRGERFFEARYEMFLSMRNTETRFLVQKDWEKSVKVSSYDETSLAQRENPLQDYFSLLPGKYEGFVEIKDFNASTYGNGRVSIKVPDFYKNLPKLSTPMFYDPSADSVGSVPPFGTVLHSAGLKYPSGKSIFLLVDVYTDSTAIPDGWTLNAEVVKSLRVFPRVTEQLKDGLFVQRKVLEVSTKTMELGSYEVEVTLKDKHNSTLARANSFKLRVIRSPQWIEENYEEEFRYLKYLATQREMKEFIKVPKNERAAAIKSFWEKLDPVPATAINELKVQYFERIEYANRNFTSEQNEGWETNMGEVYIMLGPPSEIYGSRLTQIWVYERENLVFYFFNHNLRNRNDFDDYVRDHRVRNR